MEIKNFIKEVETMSQFINDHKASCGITIDISDRIKALYDLHKIQSPAFAVENEVTIITANFGVLGSIITRDIVEFNCMMPFEFEHLRGGRDYLTVKTKKETTTLWTDYKDIEPYNRQGGLYADGSSFKYLGLPVKETKDYREFLGERNYQTQISFAIDGYRYNETWQAVDFGLIVLTSSVPNFMSELKFIINK